MKLPVRFLLIIAILFIHNNVFAITVSEIPNPRDRNEWVIDLADVISLQDKYRMNLAIDRVEKATGAEIAVVAVKSVEGVVTPKDFATQLFNRWGIGKSTNHSGLLILFVKDAKRLEMETGYGLETVLPDGYLKRLQMREMVPLFKAQRYSNGLARGTEIIVNRLIENKDGIVDELPGVSGFGVRRSTRSNSNLPWWLGLAGGGGILVGGGTWYRRKKKRTCPKCGSMLEVLSEQEEDKELNEAQQHEENLGSVDYQVWVCPEDGFVKILRNKKWFSGYSQCPSCSNQTLIVNHKTVHRATAYSSGTEEITETCTFCNYRNTHHRTLPRLQNTTGGFGSSDGGSFGSSSGGGSFGGSSGSSSSGSFGGGASGGGGAGSSW